MTTYKITFERSNGTQGNDTFSANTTNEARHDFKEVYRHDTYKIISVEEVKEVKEELESEIKTYRAEFADNEIEIFTADSDSEAINEAYRMEKEHGTLWTLDLLNEDYDIVKSVF
jgi:hypothetical protein